jgi:DNA-directed RNA polymerase specialized sigma24 family protein
VSSADPDVDSLLADIAPVLATLLADLTDRQRAIGRLIVVDGLRQSDAAARLRISRPTVSVAVGRAHIREISRLAAAVRTLFARGSQAAARTEVHG